MGRKTSPVAGIDDGATRATMSDLQEGAPVRLANAAVTFFRASIWLAWSSLDVPIMQFA
jgi:hypothetical protein